MRNPVVVARALKRRELARPQRARLEVVRAQQHGERHGALRREPRGRPGAGAEPHEGDATVGREAVRHPRDVVDPLGREHEVALIRLDRRRLPRAESIEADDPESVGGEVASHERLEPGRADPVLRGAGLQDDGAAREPREVDRLDREQIVGPDAVQPLAHLDALDVDRRPRRRRERDCAAGRRQSGVERRDDLAHGLDREPADRSGHLE